MVYTYCEHNLVNYFLNNLYYQFLPDYIFNRDGSAENHSRYTLYEGFLEPNVLLKSSIASFQLASVASTLW